MRRWLRRIGNVLLLPPALAGGFLGLAVFRVGDPAQPGAGLGGLVVGWLYGLAVTGLIRLFRVDPWAFPLVGLFCGPVPLALLVGADSTAEDRSGWLVLSALLGVLIGVLEWARVRRERGRTSA